MKYLKKYERLTKIYKDYLIWDVGLLNGHSYYIFKLVKSTPNKVFLSVIYSYLAEKDYEKRDFGIIEPFEYSPAQVDDSVIFQSNDLGECEEYMTRLITQNKFNL